MITTFGLRRSASSIAALPSRRLADDADVRRRARVRGAGLRARPRGRRRSGTVISLGHAGRSYPEGPDYTRERELLGLGRRLEPNAPPVANAVLPREPRDLGAHRLRLRARQVRAAVRVQPLVAAAAARASARARLSRKCSRVPGLRKSTFAQMPVAPASRAARTTSASCSGRSETPGRIGAMPTRASIPASVSSLIARRRWRGCAVDGSLFRQTSSSSVGIENVIVTLRAARRLLEHVDVADDHRPARDDRERVRRAPRRPRGTRGSGGSGPPPAGTGRSRRRRRRSRLPRSAARARARAPRRR